MPLIGNERLTDKELDRVAEILGRLRGEDGMSLEMVDGFFTALICGPDLVMPSEYLEEILGGDLNETVFPGLSQLNEFLNLLMRHWNAIIDNLRSGEVFVPLLEQDDQGVEHANDWAKGFLRGMILRKESWKELLDDEDHGGALVPIFALANEHHPDPKMRPYKEPITTERRDQLIAALVAGVMMIYRYFEPQRRAPNGIHRESETYRRKSPKIGRNDPCYCGSGKKYKKCCGSVTLQ